MAADDSDCADEQAAEHEAEIAEELKRIGRDGDSEEADTELGAQSAPREGDQAETLAEAEAESEGEGEGEKESADE